MNYKTNDYQIKNIIKYLDKVLLLEIAALERLSIRANETSINEVKQRMILHLKQTFDQKNKLEQVVIEFKEKYDYIGLNTTQIPVESDTNN